jgi:hypothetical protein
MVAQDAEHRGCGKLLSKMHAPPSSLVEHRIDLVAFLHLKLKQFTNE